MDNTTFEDDLQIFATEDVTAEDLPPSGALGSFASAGTIGSTVGGCASTCSTASTFS
jgi:hypothetical protein